jgi:hypothetical protein
MNEKFMIHVKHLPQLRFKAVQPLVGSLGVERTGLLSCTSVLLDNNQIWLGTIEWSRIAPQSAKNIGRPVADVVPGIDDEFGGGQPGVIGILGYNVV